MMPLLHNVLKNQKFGSAPSLIGAIIEKCKEEGVNPASKKMLGDIIKAQAVKEKRDGDTAAVYYICPQI